MQENNAPNNDHHVIDLLNDHDDDANGGGRGNAGNRRELVRMVPAFDPGVYSFLQDDLKAYVQARKVHFVIRGRPFVMERARHYGSAVVSPSTEKIAQFKVATRAMLDFAGARDGMPMFDASDHLSVSIVVRMPRPLSDFAGRNRLTGARIATGPFSNALGDIDNFAKFVLDALTNVVYVDDHQVVILKSVKTSDNTGMLNGSTKVLVEKIKGRDINLSLANNY